MDVGEYIRKKQQKAETKKTENVNVNDAINYYSAMSEEQLMQELFKVGRVSSGNVSPKELDGFYNSVRAFLSPEQAEKMKTLIMQLKMQWGIYEQ